MENILKKHLEDLNKLSQHHSHIGYEILSKYVKEDGTVNFEEMTKEDRILVDYFREYQKSEIYKLKCVYEMFPQIIEGYTLTPLDKDLQNITIYPEMRNIKNDQCFISICGEVIECPDKMTTQEYQTIFNKTIRNLLTSQTITPEMIEETKLSNHPISEENKVSTAPKK